MTVGLLPDEEGGVANDSDSSPPQSRGRGRFEKARANKGSRGQSEDTRSTSSQAADEESSSHVSVFINAVCEIQLSGLLAVLYMTSAFECCSAMF